MSDFLPLLIQAPIVGIFAFYAIQNNREWRRYLSERNGKHERSNEKLVETLDRVAKSQEVQTRALMRLVDDKADINDLTNS
jgi:hypothetical protein